MKKALFTLFCLAAMMAAGTGLRAQEVTIVLNPGWNWISFPTTDTLGFSEALGSFTPMVGDMIKSKWGYSSYMANGRWRGYISEFYPGNGYMYKSNRTTPVTLTFVSPAASQVAVTTAEPTDINATNALVGGTVTIGEGNHVFLCGVCWGTEENPTIDGDHIAGDAVAGSQTIVLDGLTPSTTYYVRAYAVTDNGLAYGEEQSFTTEQHGYVDLGLPSGILWATCNVGAENPEDYGGYFDWYDDVATANWGCPWHMPTYGEWQELLGNTTHIWTTQNGVNGRLFTASNGNSIFLPAAGGYWEGDLNNVGSGGYFWSSSLADNWPFEDCVDFFYFGSDGFDFDMSGGGGAYYECSVRPVRSGQNFSFSINAMGSPAEGGEVSGGGTYHECDECTLTATPSEGWRFVNWTENDEEITGSATYSFTVRGERTLVANFIYIGGDDHAYVDLGLPSGTLWATCNVGADNPEDYGGYFPCYDVAAAYWGSGWRMPTEAEWQELLDNTTNSWTTRNGVNGRLFTASNGNSIFLPAAGTIWGDVGSCGYYWSGSVEEVIWGPLEDDVYSYNLYFNSDDCHIASYDVEFGLSVRPVHSGFRINATPNLAEGGTVSGSGTYLEGAECTLTATPSEGWRFVNWTENGEVVSTEATYTFTATGDRTLVANFAEAEGQLNGVFSVDENSRVNFSQGNLQYQASTNIWRFATNQWDYVGADNANISETYSGWIDLFGWGTSGYDHGANCYQPWSTNKTSSDYYAYGSYDYNLYDQTGQAEWGYNAISNGGNQTDRWRTMTDPEWDYVFNTRATASGIRYAKAKVNNVNGVILLPDDWSSSTYGLNNTNESGASYGSNTITAIQWTTLEEAGAVFLPAAGYRSGVAVDRVGLRGYYWSSSYSSSSHAGSVFFYSGLLLADDSNSRYDGFSVRLVRVYSCDIIALANPTEGGTVTGGGPYEQGQNCTVTATAYSGYTFTNWTENGSVVSTDATYTFTVTGVRTLVANFIQTGGGGNAPTGAIDGLFSVSAGQQVYFSQGNLQYQASTDTWKFAENQYDCVGDDNSNISSTYSGWIDLFCWGTSGYNHGANCYQPWSTSTSNSDYNAYGNYQYNLYDQTGQADWGYNLISNGGNQTNQWRTLTQPEWNYVFNTRATTSGIRYAKANVNNVNGVILLPDYWSSSTYSLSNTNSSGASFSSNTLTASQWSTLEQAGAVFLPAAGRRCSKTWVYNVGSYGYYWSASYNISGCAYGVDFDDSNLDTNSSSYRYNGFSVRLARVAEN